MAEVSIIMPVHCTSQTSLRWLEESLRSAKATGADIVCWNDGSPLWKGSERIIREYATSHGGSHANNGPAYARNRATELAKTRYILPLDCDDLISEDAVNILLSHWRNKPLIPDLWKFGDETETPHYYLMDWSCELQYKILGIASVNVLHTVEQWLDIGGWDDSLDLYEDAEYNARLLLENCADNVHIPLIGYRQHSTSRLHSADNANDKALALLDIIGEYEMACCGKNVKKVKSILRTSETVANQTVDPNTLAAQVGAGVLVQYRGLKGAATHTSRGVATKLPYRVSYGQYLYVDPADAREENESKATPFVRFHPKEEVKEPETKSVKEPETKKDTKTTKTAKGKTAKTTKTTNTTKTTRKAPAAKKPVAKKPAAKKDDDQS